MQEEAGALVCCGRCGGTAAAARLARRRSWKAAVFGSGGAPQPADPEAAAGGTPAPRALAGTIADISPHVLVLDRAEREERLVLDTGLRAWRGESVEPTALRVGEKAIVRLVPGRRDVADRVWAGIGRVCGTISGHEDGAWLVDEGRTRERQRVVIPDGAASRIRVRFPALEPGRLIDVVGLRREGFLEGLIPASAQPVNTLATGRPVPVSDGGVITGSATWHEPDGDPGAEGLHYPAIDPGGGCGEGPAEQSCGTLPYLAVGSVLAVRNECSGLSRVLAVTGCAPSAGLFCDRCLTCGTSARGRIADLSTASFVALGGDLERACFNAAIAMAP